LPIHAGNWTATGAHSLYHAAIDAVADSGAPIDAIVWIQGEDDANAGVTANAYSDGLADLIARLRADLGDVPVLIQRLLIPLPGMDAINQGQTDYAAGDAAAFIYGTMPPTETLIASEHFTGSGYSFLGDAAARALLDTIGVPPAAPLDWGLHDRQRPCGPIAWRSRRRRASGRRRKRLPLWRERCRSRCGGVAGGIAGIPFSPSISP
jgi:hypothetical protein